MHVVAAARQGTRVAVGPAVALGTLAFLRVAPPVAPADLSELFFHVNEN
jgi:hypothetical protein